MCGRYNITDSPAVHALLESLDIDIGPLPERYNIAPTESVPCIFFQENQNRITDMRWWLTPSWSGGPSQKFAMFNARAESIENSKAYRGPFKYRRAIMPASSFIEWQRREKAKQPYEISAEQGCLLFAAVWDYWEGLTEQDGREVPTQLYSCSMLTTEAVECFSAIHHRQPVMFDQQQALQWLDGETPAPDLKQLLQQRSGQTLIAEPVDTRINNARVKSKPLPLPGAEKLVLKI